MAAEVSSLNANSLKLVSTKVINANTNYVLNLPLDGVYLIVIVNTYNVGSCWIVQTGSSVNTSLITTIFESSYFTSSASGRSQITITPGNADGICKVWSL